MQAIPNAVDVDLEFDAHSVANVQSVANDIGAGIANGVLLVRRPCVHQLCAQTHVYIACSHVTHPQVNLQHNGISATSVSLQSTVAAVPTSSITCPAGAISGICIGVHLNAHSARKPLGQADFKVYTPQT